MTATLMTSLPAGLALPLERPELRLVRRQAERLFERVPLLVVLDFVAHGLRVAGDDPLSDTWKMALVKEADRLLSLDPADLA